MSDVFDPSGGVTSAGATSSSSCPALGGAEGTGAGATTKPHTGGRQRQDHPPALPHRGRGQTLGQGATEEGQPQPKYVAITTININSKYVTIATINISNNQSAQP